jgi:TPR repeat protein
MMESAAAKNHSVAMLALGRAASGGFGLPKDLAIALKWFRAAAALGHAQAQLMVGRLGSSLRRRISTNVTLTASNASLNNENGGADQLIINVAD